MTASILWVILTFFMIPAGDYQSFTMVGDVTYVHSVMDKDGVYEDENRINRNVRVSMDMPDPAGTKMETILTKAVGAETDVSPGKCGSGIHPLPLSPREGKHNNTRVKES